MTSKKLLSAHECEYLHVLTIMAVNIRILRFLSFYAMVSEMIRKCVRCTLDINFENTCRFIVKTQRVFVDIFSRVQCQRHSSLHEEHQGRLDNKGCFAGPVLKYLAQL